MTASKREAPCSHCGSDWHYSDEHVFREAGGPCARYFGSDGTLCSSHHGRFASLSATRCDIDEALTMIRRHQREIEAALRQAETELFAAIPPAYRPDVKRSLKAVREALR